MKLFIQKRSLGMFLYILLTFFSSKAQRIKLLPSPSDSISGYSLNTCVYNGNLYFEYLLIKDGNYHLAKANGDSISILPNPDAGNGYGGEKPIVYNGNLYIPYINKDKKVQLAKFNGTSSILIPYPDGGTYANFPIVYNGYLYFVYQNVDGSRQLAKCDGNTITKIKNPTSTIFGSGLIDNGDRFYPIVYKGNLYFGYKNIDGSNQLAQYDGTSIKLISKPNGSQGYDYEGNAIIYKGNLHFGYGLLDYGYQLAKYNGDSITLIPSIDSIAGASALFQGTPVVYDNNLFLRYNNSFISQIAKYNDTSFKLMPVLGTGFGTYGDAIVCNNNLYFAYQNRYPTYQLVKYSNDSLIEISNPDAGSGYNGFPVIYNDILYLRYSNVNRRGQLATYNGISYNLIPNPDNGPGYQGDLINYDGILYFMYSNNSNNYQLGKLIGDVQPLNIINFNSTQGKKDIAITWQTSTELNTSHFIIQQSTDGSSFKDIGTVKAIGSGANGYSFIDNSPTNGINYYRLKSVDKDGSFSYSKVVSVQLTIDNYQLSITPNPAKDKVTVRGNHIVSVQVIDNLGRVVKTVSLKDSTNPTLSVRGLQAGIYHLRVQTSDGKVNGVGFVVN